MSRMRPVDRRRGRSCGGLADRGRRRAAPLAYALLAGASAPRAAHPPSLTNAPRTSLSRGSSLRTRVSPATLSDVTAIRSNSILPGRREAVTLHTADELELVGEVSLPLEKDPAATLICVHPLPTHGGMMDSHLFRKAAWRLPALADLAVLRFNTRGTSSVQGTSQGAFDNGVSERFDVAAAIEYAEFNDLPDVWLVGWSFGSDLVLRYGLDPYVRGGILLSPSLRYSEQSDLAAWADANRPLTALIPEKDDYLRPVEAARRFAAIPQTDLVAVDGAKHLWVGDAERALDEIVQRVNPSASPLPTEWDGPMETGDSSAYANRTVAAFADVEVPGPPQRKATE